MRKLSVYSKAIICLLAVFAISLVCYIFAAHKNAEEELSLAMEYGSVPLFSFDANSTLSVEIETPEDGLYRLFYENSDWTIEDVNFSPNEAGIESIVTIMSALYSTRTISFDASSENLAIYGLDEPTRITCRVSGGADYTLYIGDTTPTGENYYAMREGEDYIYLISAEEGVYLDASRDLLKDPYIINYGTIYSDVTYLKLDRDDETVFELEYGDTWQNYPLQNRLSTSTADRWTAISPIDWPIHYSNISTIVDNMIRVQVAEFVEEDCQNLEKYGLDDPKFRLSIGTDDGEMVDIVFGNQNIDGTYIYAMYEDTKQVVLFSMSDMYFLECTPEEIYNPYIYTLHMLTDNNNQTDIAEIELTLDGQTHYITNNSYDDINEYTFDGIELYSDVIGTALFEELFSALSSFTFSTVDVSGENVQKGDEVYFGYNYVLANGEEVSVELYEIPGEELRYYIFLNDEYVNLTTRESVIDSATGVRVTCNALLKHISENY
ncbi:MAG: DUF4340 domain-containing protein [Oscillospiraceae bacterium]|nr:DUF4340 domain-containing protein [Oscillospiraceae bacterium]